MRHASKHFCRVTLSTLSRRLQLLERPPCLCTMLPVNKVLRFCQEAAWHPDMPKEEFSLPTENDAASIYAALTSGVMETPL